MSTQNQLPSEAYSVRYLMLDHGHVRNEIERYARREGIPQDESEALPYLIRRSDGLRVVYTLVTNEPKEGIMPRETDKENTAPLTKTQLVDQLFAKLGAERYF